MGSLRFAMVTTFYPPHHFGGDAVFVQRLARALVRRGHSVDVLYDRDAHRTLYDGAEPEAIAEPKGLQVVALETKAPMLSCLATHQFGRPLFNGAAIREFLKSGRYDIVHYHNISLIGGPAILGLGHVSLKLYHAHDHWLVCPTHHLWRDNREPCATRRCVRCALVYRRPPQPWRYSRLLARSLEHVDVFYSPSASSAAIHNARGFGRTFEVLPSFVPDDRDLRGDITNTRVWPERYFLYAGRLEVAKGLEDVLRHFGAEAEVDLLVVGAGNDEGRLRRLAAGSPRIHFLPFRSPDALRPFFRDAVATIFPSRGHETFGQVILESLAEGTPVIARRFGAPAEIVEQSGGGLLFDDDAELAAAVDTLKDETERKRFGERGRLAAREIYGESSILRRYFDSIRHAAHVKDRGALIAKLDTP